MIELVDNELLNEQLNDMMTTSQPVETTQPTQRPAITVAKLNALYTAGMHLAQAMRQVGEAESANDLEVWILGMKHELEQLMEETK